MGSSDDQHFTDIIIYNTDDGSVRVNLYARDGSVWLNQKQLAELFATSVPNISLHIANILEERELESDSVVKDYLTTATDKATQMFFAETQNKLLYAVTGQTAAELVLQRAEDPDAAIRQKLEVLGYGE